MSGFGGGPDRVGGPGVVPADASLERKGRARMMKRCLALAFMLCLGGTETSWGWGLGDKGLGKLTGPPSAYDFQCGPRCQTPCCPDDYCPKPAPDVPCLQSCTTCDDYCPKCPPQIPCVPRGCQCDDYDCKDLPTVSCPPGGLFTCPPRVGVADQPCGCGCCPTCDGS